MNSTEEKQVFLLGRLLKRDPERVETLLKYNKLKVPQEALDFSKDILKQSIDLNDHIQIESIYDKKYKHSENAENYYRVMYIFINQN